MPKGVQHISLFAALAHPLTPEAGEPHPCKREIWRTPLPKPSLKVWVLLFVFLQLAIYSNAQKYSFKNYLAVNGLASSTINQIFQDSRGYIWFATQGGGISRFNGKDFKNFTRADGLCNNDVTCITEDRLGHIWFGTVDGASELNDTRFTNYNTNNGLTGGVIYGIYCDSASRIWIATHDGGIKIFDGKKFDSITVKNKLPSNEAYTIVQDRQGNYWFGIANGIVKYTQGKVTDYSGLKNIKGKIFFSSMLDAAGNVWFGSTSGDVIIIHSNDSIEKLELPSGLSKDFIGGITQDKRGNIWFATDHGLLKYNQKQFRLFGEAEGLSVNAVQAVMADYEGNIWAGTLTGGVNLLNSEAFVQYTDKDGLTNRDITAICQDPAGKTDYIGTDNGLYLFDSQLAPKFRKVTQIKAVENINISSLSVDKKGDLWVIAQEGVFILTRQGNPLQLKKEYHVIAGQKIISPSKIIHDTYGNTWIATYGSGVFFINDKTEKCYNTKNKFPSDKAITVFEDSQSNIWIGTEDAGVIKYDGKKFEQTSLKYGLPGKAVWSVAEDNAGNIFFGTGESGLYRFDGTTMASYTSKDGLIANYIPTLQWDKFDTCLWLGGEKGLEKIKFGNNHTIETIHNYNEQDGFNSSAINQNGLWMDNEGLLWLGTVNGLWLFNRQLDFTRKIPPKIQLTAIRLFYQKTDWRAFTDSFNHQTNLPANLILPYNKNHLTFDIQALTTSDVRYIFKLDGQDDQWSLPDKNSEITYTNISPGQTYTFKARAINAQGISSAEIISFPFTISPPWWSTWWFRVVLFIVILVSLTAFIKAREKMLREQNLKLEETVIQRTLEIARQKELVEKALVEKGALLGEKEVLLKEIHHRVKNNLQTISSLLMLQSIELKDEQAKKAIVESQNRVRSIALVHQKLYQTDGLEKVEFNAFVSDLAQQVESVYHEQSGKVSISWDIPETYLLIDTAIPLGLILNELLTNSFKYAFKDTNKGRIEMKLNNTDSSENVKLKRVNFVYWDNGPGLDPNLDIETASTLGLKLIKLLAQQIGATLSYSNKNGSEFLFIFTVRI